jgi:hypothetical protein
LRGCRVNAADLQTYQSATAEACLTQTPPPRGTGGLGPERLKCHVLILRCSPDDCADTREREAAQGVDQDDETTVISVWSGSPVGERFTHVVTDSPPKIAGVVSTNFVRDKHGPKGAAGAI